jgi:mono/diheme cytochrome c family protein
MRRVTTTFTLLAGLLLSACGSGGSAEVQDEAKAPVAAPESPTLAVDATLVLGTGEDAGASGTEPEAPAESELPPEFKNGEVAYNNYCSECHGIRGVGTDLGPPHVHIVYEPNHHGDASFQSAVANGVQAHHWPYGDMAPIEGLSEQKVAEITAYVRWLQREAGIQ